MTTICLVSSGKGRMSVFKVKSIVVQIQSARHCSRQETGPESFLLNRYASHDASIRRNWTRVPEGI
ncbi:hypothetical protein PILCRDRAFT_732820 [Piloderma croceum F 1598]|uniref:Uncharacterized protein n=1 Tax=Piloderma croceum (strain F 1598) TaxID=765440 RepID=A0A0C3EKR2_PILCF|nr:hypothetical protein PILCRDRAFT_732820 [Piloderma croceum F 1598]